MKLRDESKVLEKISKISDLNENSNPKDELR